MIRYKINNVLYLSVILLLYSCNDSKIAKDLVGTWSTSYVTAYEDGTKSYVDEQVTFKKDNPNIDGGSFIEIRTGREEDEEDEYNVKYSWVSKIEGTWEINIENLALHYNITTLEVEIGQDDVDYKLKSEAFIWNDLGSLIWRGVYMNNNLYKELKKDTYKRMFRYYQKCNVSENDNDFSYSDVQIHGSVLSYVTADLGRLKYYRVKEGDTFNRKKKDEDVDIENDREEQKQLIQEDEESEVTTTDEIDYSHRLSGFVDKYEIHMYLNINDDGNVSGYYYYDSQGPEKKIYLSGQLLEEDSNTKLTLNCDNQDIFDGYIENNKYSGEFTNGSKQLVFNLRILN